MQTVDSYSNEKREASFENKKSKGISVNELILKFKHQN